MAKYSCEICQKTFAQKGHLEDHHKRKRPCKKDNTIEALVEQKVKEALSKTNTAKETAVIVTMDYSKKTREELIAICKEKKVKGYGGKKKENIIQLLTDSPEKIHINDKILSVISISKEKNTNISPLRYPGGKTRAINILYNELLANFPNRKMLLSPFFGGGSFELFLSSKGYTIVGNDLFTPLYKFWITTQTNREILIDRVKELMPVSKESFHALRKKIIDDDTDAITIATSFFIINRTSFSGATLSGGFSEEASKTRLTDSSVKRLSDCNVEKIIFSNVDCNIFLDNHPETATTVIYADPPYYIKDFIYGKDGNMHDSFDHKMFAEKIRKRNDWIISYNNCDYIKKLYDGCRIIPTSWSYGMNKSKNSSEIIILPPIS
jgi:DNA adenine methylase